MKITISVLKQLLVSMKQGDIKSKLKVERLLKKTQREYKAAYKIKDYNTIARKLIPRVNEFYIAGYEPSLCFLEDEYGYFPYDEKPWGDYYNEFAWMRDVLRRGNIRSLRKRLRDTPLHTYEEHYLGTFYDVSSKTLLSKDDPRVRQINKIVLEMNNTFETLSIKEFNAKCIELLKLLYGDKYDEFM